MKKQEELRKRLEESQETELSPEDELAEKLRVKKLQEDADLLLAQEAFGKRPVLQEDADLLLAQENATCSTA
ncbi:unnamed protein product [Oncorhynchus mykiss]|uniref:Uncharacterized protein n=1 Tax=Oncorhynchus mykiss TaxID=8022 RepID=A0A060Z4Q8_ONCMY|nr:unnamed protein product [Oncorhynchus mykiss]